MSYLTIRNLSSGTHAALAKLATANHRSINAEAIMAIEERVKVAKDAGLLIDEHNTHVELSSKRCYYAWCSAPECEWQSPYRKNEEEVKTFALNHEARALAKQAYRKPRIAEERARRTTAVTHGHTRNYSTTREYNSWAAMIARCTNPKNDRYDRYGGRGIRVCDRWRTFANFFADMGPCETDLASKVIRYLLSDCCVDRGDTFSFVAADKSRCVNCGEHGTQSKDDEGVDRETFNDPSEIECGCDCGCLGYADAGGVVCSMCREACGGGG